MTAQTPHGRDFFELDADGCGIEIDDLAKAIQVWTGCQPVPMNISVASVARSFNVEPEIVALAVEGHPWMFLCGSGDDFDKITIEHDGE